MYFKKSWFLIFIPLLLVSCSNVSSIKYKDTSHLELPPRMKIVEKPKPVVAAKEKLENTGLGNNVILTGSTEKPVIKIKKLFDRSWDLVEQALKLSEIEITDKNREQGVFYVKFDPDEQDSDDVALIDTMTFFFFADSYEEASYKVSVMWRDSDTEVTAELVDQANSDLLDDDEDRDEGSIDGGAKLVNTLYKIIKDDLPIN